MLSSCVLVDDSGMQSDLELPVSKATSSKLPKVTEEEHAQDKEQRIPRYNSLRRGFLPLGSEWRKSLVRILPGTGSQKNRTASRLEQ